MKFRRLFVIGGLAGLVMTTAVSSTTIPAALAAMEGLGNPSNASTSAGDVWTAYTCAQNGLVLVFYPMSSSYATSPVDPSGAPPVPADGSNFSKTWAAPEWSDAGNGFTMQGQTPHLFYTNANGYTWPDGGSMAGDINPWSFPPPLLPITTPGGYVFAWFNPPKPTNANFWEIPSMFGAPFPAWGQTIGKYGGGGALVPGPQSAMWGPNNYSWVCLPANSFTKVPAGCTNGCPPPCNGGICVNCDNYGSPQPPNGTLTITTGTGMSVTSNTLLVYTPVTVSIGNANWTDPTSFAYPDCVTHVPTLPGNGTWSGTTWVTFDPVYVDPTTHQPTMVSEPAASCTTTRTTRHYTTCAGSASAYLWDFVNANMNPHTGMLSGNPASTSAWQARASQAGGTSDTHVYTKACGPAGPLCPQNQGGYKFSALAYWAVTCKSLYTYTYTEPVPIVVNGAITGWTTQTYTDTYQLNGGNDFGGTFVAVQGNGAYQGQTCGGTDYYVQDFTEPGNPLHAVDQIESVGVNG